MTQWWKRCLSGALAGVAATGVMSLVMLGAKRLGVLGEPPPRRLTRALLTPLGALRPSGHALDVAATLAHFGYGAALGVLYGLAPARLRTSGSGTLFGLGVWGVNYAGWLPQVGLMPPPRRDRAGRPTSMLLAHAVYGGTLAAFQRLLDPRASELAGKVVVVCGGSRGLGRAIARELQQQGARVAICGRSQESLTQTRSWLEGFGGPVVAEACDLRREGQTLAFFERVKQELGPIDVVIANAATIEVGPIETLTPADVDAAMNEIFGSAVRAALTALPEMRARGRGSIAFISSIGGRIGLPHLVAYSAAKFAEVGFAEALHAEVAKDGIKILTVTPGLMRTGSHLHATFRGQSEREFGWFGAAAITPLLSIDADRAARLIVDAIARERRFLTFTPAARLGAWLHDAAPNAWALLASTMARLLPRAPDGPDWSLPNSGHDIARQSSSRLLRLLVKRSESLALRHGQ